MTWTAEVLTGNVVVLGDFNPAIVTPGWLEKNRLIGADDAKAATEASNLIVSRRGSHIPTDAFVVQVRPDRLIVQSNEALNPVIRDLAAGILILLAHTPVRAIGLNYDAHYKLPSRDDWHKLGDTFAPKDIWYQLFSPEKHNAGMTDLQIRIDDAPRPSGEPTSHFKNVSIQPSGSVLHGVYLSLNDHHQVTSNDEATAAEVAAFLIQEYWEGGLKESSRIFEGLLDAACSKNGA